MRNGSSTARAVLFEHLTGRLGGFVALTLIFAIACVTPNTARGQGIYPPGTIYAAGSVYPSSSLTSGNIAGGFFGNKNGTVYDLAVTSSVGGNGPDLTIFAGNGDGTFTNTASYYFSGIEDGLSTVFAGPFTGPGKVDLVATDDESNLFLISGNGDGTFTPPVPLNQVAYTLQAFPNANGTDNLVTTALHGSSSTVTVLMNNGTGSFSPQVLLSNATWEVSEVDYLNIAGTPSLLLQGVDGTARISTDSNGTFSAPTNFNLGLPAGAAPVYGVVSFLLNGNTGFAALGNGMLYVWIGNSNGTFQTPYAEDFTAYSPVQLATADLNGDQIPDLVLLGGGQFTGAQNALVLFGSSSGNFSFQSRVGPGVYGSQLVIGDANGDGHPDLILLEPYQGITTLLNQGNGTFPEPFAYSAPSEQVNGQPVNDYPVAMATADFNGDGFNDVVLANGLNPSTGTNTNTISSFLGGAGGTLTYRDDYAVGNQPIGIALAPVNGEASVFTANALDEDVSFLQGNGDGTFAAQQTFTGGNLAMGISPVAIVAGTIDSSGFPGVIVGDQSGGITVFTHSEGTWTATQQYTVGASAGAITSMALADVNGDGKQDLLVALAATCAYNINTGLQTAQNGSVLAFPGTGNGSFSTAISISSSQQNWNPGFVTTGFLTSSSDPTILVLNSTGSTCVGGGIQSSPKAIALYSGAIPSSLQETDIASPFAGITFASQSSSTPQPFLATVGDANGDGINDLIFTESGLVAVLPGQGYGIFGAPVLQVASSDSAGLVTGSFFASGSATAGHDLAVASSQGVTDLRSLLSEAGSTNAPYADFLQTALDFSSVQVNHSVSLQFTLNNLGDGLLVVPYLHIQHEDGSAAPEFVNQGVQCGSATNPNPIAIEPGASCAFTVAFEPTAGGTFTGEMILEDNSQQSNVTSTPLSSGFAPYEQVIPLQGFAPGAPIQISPSRLPGATVGQPYSQIFTATGGVTGGYTFSESGGLPSGVTFSGGLMSGTPTQRGNFPLTVVATDSGGNTGQQAYTWAVSCPTLSISPATLPAATMGTSYHQLLTAAGGTAPYSWILVSTTGTQGLTITAGASPSISGIPTVPGQADVDWFVTDANGCVGSFNQQLTVNAPLSVNVSTDSEVVTVTDQVFVAPVLSVGAPYASYSNGSLGFSGQPTQILTLSNGGQQPLIVANITFSNPAYSLASISCSTGSNSVVTTLPSGGQCLLTISYSPSGGSATGMLVLTDNAAASNVTNVQSVANYVQTISLNGLASGNGPPVSQALVGITINPGNPTASPQSTQQFTATGLFSDDSTANLTTSVTWSSASPTVATISNTPGTQGLATVVAPGQTTITATSGAISATATLIVPAPLTDTEGIHVTDAEVLKVSDPSVVQLTASPAGQVADGTPVTLTAQITTAVVGAPAPTGSVTFLHGSTVLGSAALSDGAAVLTISTLPSGNDNITAQYNGDAVYTAAQSPVETVSVNAPNYTVSANPTSLILAAGQSGDIAITVTPEGFSGTVMFTCGTLPAFVSCAFHPANGSLTVPSGSSSPQTIALSISVASMIGMAERPMPVVLAIAGSLGLLGLLPFVRMKRKRLHSFLFLLALAVVFIAGMGGCSTALSYLPPKGSQSLTITGVGSGSITHQLKISVDITD